MDKDDGAFLTIGELARELGVAQHILRYWETRFSQLKPLQRSGNRRYYRPADVAVAQHINRLLNEEGFTVRGAQRVLSGRGASQTPELLANAAPSPATGNAVPSPAQPSAPVIGTAPKIQGELPISDGPSPSSADGRARSTDHVGDSDLALLIARLTVIRQNLRDAIEPG